MGALKDECGGERSVEWWIKLIRTFWEKPIAELEMQMKQEFAVKLARADILRLLSILDSSSDVQRTPTEQAGANDCGDHLRKGTKP